MNANNTNKIPFRLPLYWLFELSLPKAILTDIMIFVVNHLLKSNSFTNQKLQPHLHKTIGINLGENLSTIILKVEKIGNSYVLVKDRTLTITMEQTDVQIIFADNTFTLTNLPNLLHKLKYQKDEFFAEVKIIGKVDFAETLSFLLKNLNIDFEADISAFIGDVPAHFLGEIFRKIFSFTTNNNNNYNFTNKIVG